MVETLTSKAGPDQRPELDWWKEGVIYHVYPRSFADSDGDGVGDLRGIVERLDYLNDGTADSLGVSAIWLSPIYLSPGRDAGYDVADHMVIDPVFGGSEAFDELLREAHKREIAVIMDLVLNHTSDVHPWFLDARSSKTSEHRDWYVWQAPRPGGAPPNNWRSFFGGPAWALDHDTGEYYLHTFLREQPDLNWHNRDVQQAALEIVRYWLERGVDGFRLDVFNAYFKHPELHNNPRRLGRTAWSRQRHINNKDRPELHGFLGELRDLVDRYPGAVTIGETFDGKPELAASYGDKLHMVFNFDFLQQDWDAASIQHAVARWDRLLAAEHTWPSYVLSNHDNPRHATRYGQEVTLAEGDARAKVAACLLLTLRGTPFVYYGEEIGMRDADIPSSELRDLCFAHGFTRDPARSPMQWSAGRNGGFTSGAPWIRLAPDFRERNVEEQAADHRSLLRFYRELIWLRRRSAALQTGSWTPLINRPRGALAYLRTGGEDAVLVALNFTATRQRLRFEESLPTRRWIARVSTRRSDIGWRSIIDSTLDLGPYEASVFQMQPDMESAASAAGE
jgi:alpha-glucosidase